MLLRHAALARCWAAPLGMIGCARSASRPAHVVLLYCAAVPPCRCSLLCFQDKSGGCAAWGRRLAAHPAPLPSAMSCLNHGAAHLNPSPLPCLPHCGRPHCRCSTSSACCRCGRSTTATPSSRCWASSSRCAHAAAAVRGACCFGGTALMDARGRRRFPVEKHPAVQPNPQLFSSAHRLIFGVLSTLSTLSLSKQAPVFIGFFSALRGFAAHKVRGSMGSMVLSRRPAAFGSCLRHCRRLFRRPAAFGSCLRRSMRLPPHSFTAALPTCCCSHLPSRCRSCRR